MRFEFSSANQIIFGEGVLSRVGDITSEFGECALIVTGGGSVPVDLLVYLLEAAGITSAVFRVESEPEIQTVLSGIELAKQNRCELVIGFGGGSVLDTAKAIAAMLTNPGELTDYLEVVGLGREITHLAAPLIAIPTTAGTGTEVTRNAVITSPKHRVKVSMRGRKMIPSIALVDPELTYTMPPPVTASTGMDAFNQVIEGYVSTHANPKTDIISSEGIKRGARSLLKAYHDGQDRQARRDMCLTSLFGGLALANGGLGAVHGFAGPIGGMFNAPHGVICACLLPHVIKYNMIALHNLAGRSETETRYQNIARWVTGNSHANVDDGVNWIKELAESLDIPRLRSLGIHRDDFSLIIEKSKVSSSMQKNPVKLDESFLRSILDEAY